VMNEREWRAMIAGEETCTNVVSKAFGGVNATGFSALLGGITGTLDGKRDFVHLGKYGYFWEPRELNETTSYQIYLQKVEYKYMARAYKFDGLSVRCVKDY
ncbi:MAG: hypothetical protein IKS97_11860, partial [Fibrobacter sp.]|nr:hypothetical protein [Fibrobacter sp.]